MIASLHRLYAVREVNTGKWLGGIINTTIDMNPTTLGEPSSGSLFPHIPSLVGAAPTATWSTHAMKDHFDNLGNLGESPSAGHTDLRVHRRLIRRYDEPDYGGRGHYRRRRASDHVPDIR